MMKKISAIICIVFVLCTLLSIPASAKAYQTYTYSLDGFALNSPDAYVPQAPVIDSEYMGLIESSGLNQPIKAPTDLEVDDQGNVYIVDSDKATSRVIVLDRYYKLKHVIQGFTNDQGNPDSLSEPHGVFITDDTIFVCDTGKARIVTFDREFNFVDIIREPESELFGEDEIYKPVAIAVDQFDRLYVVSSQTYQGIIVMTRDGDFTGFIGAQKTTLSAWDVIWRRFQTQEQRENSKQNISTAYNNIAITEEGFIYVTITLSEETDQEGAATDKSGTFSPVKLLNAAGEEIMRRNGFWSPVGEITTTQLVHDEKVPTGPSKIVDAAVGPEKTWSIIDQKRSKVYTYDFDGNLLFVFGDTGHQIGNIMSNGLNAITYQDDKMLLLDAESKSFTVFKRTGYGDILIQALNNQNNRQYDVAVDDWTEILKRNSNYDAAYIGIGQAHYRNGDYKESIEYFKAAYDTANYDNSYKEIRKEWISKYILLIPVGIVAICLAWSFFMKYANKINKKAAVAGGKRNFKEELLYGFYVIFHPFDGFWDLKHEKRGSLKAATVFIIATVFAFFYKAVGSGYAVNQQTVYANVISVAISVLLPMALWAVSNWCLTCLFDGEGNFKDIVIAVGYSVLPLILTIIPTTIASNFVISSEVAILDFITTVGFIWCLLLIFLGMMVTHDYSMGKNVLTTLGTIVAMIFIMFIGILFTTLLGKVVGFITNIVTEISYRA